MEGILLPDFSEMQRGIKSCANSHGDCKVNNTCNLHRQKAIINKNPY